MYKQMENLFRILNRNLAKDNEKKILLCVYIKKINLFFKKNIK